MNASADTVELFLFGFASVADIALLMVVGQRVNRGRVAVWLKALVAATALVHTAIFFRLMILDARWAGVDSIDRVLVIAICGGLLTLPSAMLHAALRLNQTGLSAVPTRDVRYGWLYLPLASLPLIAIRVWRSPATDFISQVGAWKVVFLIWLLAANSISIGLFLKLRTRRLISRGDAFLKHLCVVIVVITSLAIGYAVFSVGTPFEIPLRLMATLSPFVASLLFVWYSLRGRMLPLVMERTFGYAVIAVGLLLLHRLAVTPVVQWMGEKTSIDFAWIEGMLIAAFVLSSPRLRSRVGESLRYLFSNNMHCVRDAMRNLALRLTQNSSQDRDELLRWFSGELRAAIDLEFVTILIEKRNSNGTPQLEWVSTREDFSDESQLTMLASLRVIHQACDDRERVCERGMNRTDALETAFEIENALLAIRFSYRTVQGSVVLGNRLRNDRLSREQIVILSLIVDQFAATLHNRHEERLRQQSQRKLLQQEKLSVLGLMSGSLAHEIRNPLSSMRTLTSLVIEQLGEDNECTAELKMVIGEIDRLSRTTKQLLDYAKPERESSCDVSPDATIRRIMSILEYLARQYHVETQVQLECETTVIAMAEASLSEIVFNLVKNSIEAAREVEEGHVSIRSHVDAGDVIISVCDNGPGIPEARRTQVYEPFVTNKFDGSGMGLFTVAERVRELGARIEHRDNEPCGTVFELRIPLVPQSREWVA